MSEVQQLVAVDLGSNSFHMVIARLVDGQLTIIDRMRERVQLAAGLDERNNLASDAIERGIDCVRRFGERLQRIDGVQVRAVGTNTLRKARNARAFLERASAALGHPVEVIPGREEARLIYLGVAHTLGSVGRRLVVDIGGGSTELIIGEGFATRRAESLHMGCISYSNRYFPDGKLRREGFREAITAARVELETIEQAFRRTGWVGAVGSSGTILAIEAILRLNGWGDGITRDGLRSLKQAMIDAGRLSKLSLPGLSAERANVLPGGVAILDGVFKTLQIDRMLAATGALREGLLYDTIGRITHEDVRERSTLWMCERYAIDRGQSSRVEATALALFDRAAAAWDLHHPELRLVIGWAARLHEIGLALSYSGYHKHGAYLLANSDMPGFSREQQSYLAALVGGHRRRLRPERVAELRALGGTTAVRLAVLLRLAATLNRGRDPEGAKLPELTCAGNILELRFADGWLEEHPMTATDLQYEQSFIAATGITLAAS
ncbi:MAG: exopolyphosphatase [Deltaproteobacteria bacterium]|nr:exopolyphosphatase [Nannocystaceae bacterium]